MYLLGLGPIVLVLWLVLRLVNENASKIIAREIVTGCQVDNPAGMK